MLQTTRYDQREEKSTIHKMIHRLSNDCSSPPQLSKTITPGSELGHNNNRPFSYTRPNESTSPSSKNDIIYAHIQLDKKKSQRSHSDSDEGLGLERKDSSRENSPAEKECRRADYYINDLQSNKINSLKSLHDDERSKIKHHRNLGFATNNSIIKSTETKLFNDFVNVDQDLSHKGEKSTSIIFFDTSNHRQSQITDSKDKNDNKLINRLTNDQSIFSKTSELSARRDLLESRMKSRLISDEMFICKNNSNLPKTIEHEIIDKPIVPSPVIPNHIDSLKQYVNTQMNETRMNSEGEKYIFKKEIPEVSDMVYGYENKINKVLSNKYLNPYPKDYTIEARTSKYRDKYTIETPVHSRFTDKRTSSTLNDRIIKSPEKELSSSIQLLSETENANDHTLDKLLLESSENYITKKSDHYLLPENEVIFYNDYKKLNRQVYQPKIKSNFDKIKEKGKSTEQLDELDYNIKWKSLGKEYITRSYENLISQDFINAMDIPKSNAYKKRLSFLKYHLDDIRKGSNDDFDTDISQVTNNMLDLSKYFKETRIMHKCFSSNQKDPNDCDVSAQFVENDHNNFCSSCYNSNVTAKDTIHYEIPEYENASRINKKDDQRIIEDSKKSIKRSRNKLDYLNDSDTKKISKNKLSKSRFEIFDGIAQRPSMISHENKLRHKCFEMREFTDRGHRGDTILTDSDRKDRLTDSGIENDYRRDSQETDIRREPLESEDEGFVTMEFIKQERQHTDRNMNLNVVDANQFNKYIKYQENKNIHTHPLTSKPPTGADIKKYEKKTAKKNDTMKKVKELFKKKEKKVNVEKDKKDTIPSNNTALTDDEVMIRYKEYRGDQLKSTSSRNFESKILENGYRQRRRLSTPNGSPKSPQPSRLSRSTGTLTQPETKFHLLKHALLIPDNRNQEFEKKGWFKSLSRKNKSSAKLVDKKSGIPDSQILMIGTEDEEVSSVPERMSVQKNLRFFGDTDQESNSSNHIERNKRRDEYTKTRRQINNSNRYSTGIILPQRKSSRFTESALSSGESTTGDSSQQSQNSQKSQRSVVYLHAATVGEIPGPNERRRAASREELSRPLTAHTRTVSRSVSVLSPWRPRNYHEPHEINYQQHQLTMPISMRRRQRNHETVSRRGKESKRNKDSKTGTINSSTLESKEKQTVNKTVSTESLANKSQNFNSRQEVNRSTSIPHDSNKSAGWFKMKSKKSQA